MDSSAIDSNALLNAAAVWFIFKAIEVIVFVVYDTFTAIKRWVRNWRWRDRDPNPSEVPDDPTRVRLEYVMSGAGFLDLSFCCRKRRPLLLFICILSTVTPLGVFVLELFSIVLGNESRECETSTDLNVVSSPSLVLFGEGERHGNISSTLEESGFNETQGLFRPCISWSSNHAGVDYLSSVCADLVSSVDHVLLADLSGIFSSPPAIGAFALQDTGPQNLFFLSIHAVEPRESSLDLTQIGTITFSSDVLVNGKNVLYQNATCENHIKDETKNEIREDVRYFEKEIFKGSIQARWVEIGTVFGFIWPDPETYVYGIGSLVYAVLAQTTRDPIKSAVEMSTLNSIGSMPRTFDISCEEKFPLPRTVSIIIIVIGVVFRFILIFLPTSKSAVEVVLEESEDRQCSGQNLDAHA